MIQETLIYHVHVGKLVRQLWDGNSAEGPECVYEGSDTAIALTKLAEASAAFTNGDSAALFVLANEVEVFNIPVQRCKDKVV